MPITFSCDNCHSSFTVDSQLAGRTARCRKCSRRMTIPSDESDNRRMLPSAAKMADGASRAQAGTARAAGRNNPVGAARSLQQWSDQESGRPIGWAAAVNSQVGLKPITMVSMKAPKRREMEEDDDPRSQYKMVIPRDMRKPPAVVTKPAEFAWETYLQGIRSYRQFFNLFAVLFRKINEIAYGVSLLFLNLAIVAAIMSKHSLVVLGISMVVLLNIVQLVSGVANLIATQFRGNIVRGLLFLFPPVTAYYLWKNWYRWNKAIKRITSPIIWLVVVLAAYTYIPWLNGSKEGKTSWSEAAESIKKDVTGTISDLEKKAADLKEKLPAELDKTKLEDLRKNATEAVDDLKTRAKQAIGSGPSSEKPGSDEKAEPPPGKQP